MRVLIFGATGMVGQGVLRECLRDAGVAEIVTVGRGASGRSEARLREIVLPDLFAATSLWDELRGFDAAFFCLGISSVGMTEAEYRRVTYDLTLSIAKPLAEGNPGMTFVYVSGAGTNEHGRMMWARVKGRTESALAALPFKAVYLFRPGFIQPRHGVVSKTGWYRALYAATAPISSAVGAVFSGAVTSTDRVGRAMLAVARNGFGKRILGNGDINRAAAGLVAR